MMRASPHRASIGSSFMAVGCTALGWEAFVIYYWLECRTTSSIQARPSVQPTCPLYSGLTKQQSTSCCCIASAYKLLDSGMDTLLSLKAHFLLDCSTCCIVATAPLTLFLLASTLYRAVPVISQLAACVLQPGNSPWFHGRTLLICIYGNVEWVLLGTSAQSMQWCEALVRCPLCGLFAHGALEMPRPCGLSGLSKVKVK